MISAKRARKRQVTPTCHHNCCSAFWLPYTAKVKARYAASVEVIMPMSVVGLTSVMAIAAQWGARARRVARVDGVNVERQVNLIGPYHPFKNAFLC